MKKKSALKAIFVWLFILVFTASIGTPAAVAKSSSIKVHIDSGMEYIETVTIIWDGERVPLVKQGNHFVEKDYGERVLDRITEIVINIDTEQEQRLIAKDQKHSAEGDGSINYWIDVSPGEDEYDGDYGNDETLDKYVVELPDEEIPAGTPEDVTNEEPTNVIVLDEEIAESLTELPKTGGIPAELFYGIGLLIACSGIFLELKKK